MNQTKATDIPFYPVMVHCIIFGFPQNRLSLMVREQNDGLLDFPRCYMKDQKSLDDTAMDLLNGVAQDSRHFLSQLCTFVDRIRNSEESACVHVVYFSLLSPSAIIEPTDENTSLRWADLQDPAFHPEQREVIVWSRKKLKRRISVEPIAFRLLPELFTLSQLQSLYEQIANAPIDKRNFRKRVNELYFIERTEMIDKSGSKRGAHLFRFNNEAYVRTKAEFKL